MTLKKQRTYIIMSSAGKNHLWKTIGKQSPNYYSHDSNDVNELEEEQDKRTIGMNRCSQGTRPPPLVINNNLAEKYSAQKTNQQPKDQPRASHDIDHYLTASNKFEQQQRQSFQKTFEISEVRQPGSPWINDHGDKISHIIKKSDLDDQLSFSIEKGVQVVKEETFLSLVQRDKKNKGEKVYNRPKDNQAVKERQIYVTQSIPYVKAKEKVQHRAEVSHVEMYKMGETRHMKSHKLQQLHRQVRNDKQTNFPQQINQLKHTLALERISHDTKVQQCQIKLKDLAIQVNKKSTFVYKLNLKLKNLMDKSKQLQRLYHQKIKAIPEELKQFRANYLVKVLSQVYERLVKYEYEAKQWSQKCLQEEYDKRRLVEKESQEVKKRVIEQQGLLHQLQQDKNKLDKTNRDLQFGIVSSQAQQKQLQAKTKKLLQQKSELNIELQTITQRNNSLKEHIANLTKSVYNKSSKEGEQGDQLVRKCNRMRKELEEKDHEVKEMKRRIEKMKQDQERVLEGMNRQIRSVESKMTQYKQRLRQEVESVEEKLKEEQITHKLTKQSLQHLEVKIKENELLHYKQIQTYDQALRQIQKDLQILALKKNIKEEQLTQKQLQLSKRQNQLLGLQDDLRQHKNQLECAMELYNQNILLLHKKQDLLSSQYHETLQMQTQSKAAWYQRYYKLYSPNNMANPHSREKHLLTTNKFINSLRTNFQKTDQQYSLNPGSSPFVDPPYLNDVKKIAIKERLHEIDNLKSQARVKQQQSPRNIHSGHQVLSKLQSPRAMNLIDKAKSIETQRPGVKSPWRQRPQRDNNVKTSDMVSLSIARSQSPKNSERSVNKEFLIVRAKLDQIKSSISNEIMVAGKS